MAPDDDIMSSKHSDMANTAGPAADGMRDRISTSADVVVIAFMEHRRGHGSLPVSARAGDGGS
jgi:hypothetical protein